MVEASTKSLLRMIISGAFFGTAAVSPLHGGWGILSKMDFHVFYSFEGSKRLKESYMCTHSVTHKCVHTLLFIGGLLQVLSWWTTRGRGPTVFNWFVRLPELKTLRLIKKENMRCERARWRKKTASLSFCIHNPKIWTIVFPYAPIVTLQCQSRSFSQCFLPFQLFFPHNL